MPFDINSLLQDPTFGAGMGIMGAGSPVNSPMARAYANLSAQRKQMLDAELQRAQIAQDTQRTNLYGQQIQQQTRANDMAVQRQQAMMDFVKRLQGAMPGQMGGGVQPGMPQLPAGQPGPTMPSPQGMPPAGGPGMPPGGPGMGPQGPAPSLQAPPQPPSVQTPPAPPANFGWADQFVKKIEGGLNPNDAGKGPTNFGINQTANPDINVKGLTPDQAAQIRQQRYWLPEFDKLPPAASAIAYDASVNQGQGYARDLLSKTGGEPLLMLYQRLQDYKKLAAGNPLMAQQLPAWKDRLNQLSQHVQTTPSTLAAPDSSLPQAPGTPPGQMPLHKQLELQAGGLLTATSDKPEDGLKMLIGGMTPDYEGQRTALATNADARDAQRLQLERFKAQLAAQDTQTRGRTATVAEHRETREAAQQDTTQATNKATYWKTAATTGANLDLLSNKLSELSQHPGFEGIYGAAGAFPNVPGGQAANAEALRTSVIKQQAKETLQSIREGSKSGGALGNVSDNDVNLLETAIVNLDKSQSAKEARTRIGELQQQMARVRNISIEGYERTYHESPIAGLPSGSRYVGTQKGKAVYRTPDGKLGTVD